MAIVTDQKATFSVNYKAPRFGSSDVAASISVMWADENEDTEVTLETRGLVPGDNNHLILSCATSQHSYDCADVRAVMESGLDSKLFFHVKEELRLGIPWMLAIRGDDQFVRARLSEDFLAGGRKVDMEIRNFSGQAYWEHLCFINEGEGIKSLRSAVNQWLVTQEEVFYNEHHLRLICSAPTHGYNEDAYLKRLREKGTRTTREYLAQLWAIHGEGACLACLDYRNGYQDVPDLD